jgi:hypothetical protein
MTLQGRGLKRLGSTPQTEPCDECAYLRDGRQIVLTQMRERSYER